jgi:sensor histidine kinase YesM
MRACASPSMLILIRWRAGRWLIDILARSVGGRWWLHFNIRLSSTKISLILAIIPSSSLSLGIGRRYLLLVGLRLLGLVVGIVLRLSVSKRCSSRPSSAIERLSACTTSSASTKAAAHEEEEEGDDENDG